MFVLLFVLNFLSAASFNAVSLLPPYLQSLGAGKSLIGLFASVNTLALMVAVVVFGKQLVRLDRPVALRWGYGLLMVSYVGMWLGQGSLVLLFALKAVGSLSFVFSFSMLMNMVYDGVPTGKQTGRIALFGISGLLSNPATAWGGELVLGMSGGQGHGGPGLFLFGAVLASLALALSFAVSDRKDRHATLVEAHVLDLWRQPALRPLLLLGFLYGPAWSVFQTYLPGFTLERLNTANLTAYAVPFALVSIVSRFVFASRLDTMNRKVLLGLGLGTALVSFGLAMLLHTWVVLWLVGGLFGFAHSMLFPLLSSLHVQRAPAGQRDSYNNAFIFFNNFGAFALVPLLGALGDLFGYSAVFAGMGGILAVCLALALFLL